MYHQENQSANSNYIENGLNVNNKVVDLSQIKYIVKDIDQSDQYYYASQISKNEKYLVYGGDDLLLEIYDLELDQLIREIGQDYAITACQFTDDSSLLFVGSYQYVLEYNIQKNFKLNQKLYLHHDYVLNLITIKHQFIITTSYDKIIIKTDTKYKKQLYKLVGHTDSIYALEYNEIDDIIISGSHDKSIKLWSCKDKSIFINKDNQNMILQIQLINNRKNLLSLDLKGKLVEWKIDLVKRDLIQLKQFNEQDVVLNFYQVNQGQSLLLICDQYIKILNNEGKVINIIDNLIKNSSYLDCKQLDSANFIQLRSLSNYFIQHRQNLDSNCIKLKLLLNLQNNLLITEIQQLIFFSNLLPAANELSISKINYIKMKNCLSLVQNLIDREYTKTKV